MKDKEEILQKRAKFLAVPEKTETRLIVMDAICFLVAGERYGLEKKYVGEVSKSLDITPVPCTPAWLAGVIHRHGRIIGLLDLKVLFNIPKATSYSHILTVQIEDMELGILAEAVPERRTIFNDELQDSNATTTLNTPPKWLKAITHDGLLILDGTAIYNDPTIIIGERGEE